MGKAKTVVVSIIKKFRIKKRPTQFKRVHNNEASKEQLTPSSGKSKSIRRFFADFRSTILKRPQIRIRKIYIIIIPIGVLLGIFIIAIGELFTIRTVIVDTIPGSAPRVVASSISASTLKGKNLLSVSEEEIAVEVMKGNPVIKSVTATKRLPSTVLITIDTYRPKIALAVNDGFFILGQEGAVLAKTKQEEDVTLPLIRYYQQLNYYQFQTGDSVQYNDIVTAVHFVEIAESIGVPVNTIDITGIDMIVLNSNEKRFTFTTQKDIEAQEYQFKTIVRQLKIEGREYVSLDLRFDKPVLKLR